MRVRYREELLFFFGVCLGFFPQKRGWRVRGGSFPHYNRRERRHSLAILDDVSGRNTKKSQLKAARFAQSWCTQPLSDKHRGSGQQGLLLGHLCAWLHCQLSSSFLLGLLCFRELAVKKRATPGSKAQSSSVMCKSGPMCSPHRHKARKTI